jgi:hypothetical protein
MIEACQRDPIVAHVTEARTDLTIGRPGFADAIEERVSPQRVLRMAQLGEKGHARPRDLDGVFDLSGRAAAAVRARRTALPVHAQRRLTRH